MRELFDEELFSRIYQSLMYGSLCMHPNVELMPGHIVPKINSFIGKGYPIAHLNNYCSILVGNGHVEDIRMRLFIQSLSGLAHAWYNEQDFIIWHTLEDMVTTL